MSRGVYTTLRTLLFGISMITGAASGTNFFSPELFQPAAAIAVDAISPTNASQFGCLPDDLKEADAVAYKHKSDGGVSHVTIKDKLTEMRAQCKDGKLVDSKGKEITFFRVACWGNPPADEDEIRQREQAQLEKLRKRYTVIVFECDPRIN